MNRAEAINIIRDARCTSPLRDALEALIPELAESEDERIREKIKKCIIYDCSLTREETDEMLAWLEKQKETNPSERFAKAREEYEVEWSEEDEKNCNRILRFLEPHKTFFPTKETKEELQNWLKNRLKSLRPQPKQEWSEEDEKTINDACTFIDKYADSINKLYLTKSLELYRLSEKLKSLRPSWKPSEEQIYSLGTVVKGYDECTVGSVGYHLKEMYEQLKKLI